MQRAELEKMREQQNAAIAKVTSRTCACRDATQPDPSRRGFPRASRSFSTPRPEEREGPSR